MTVTKADMQTQIAALAREVLELRAIAADYVGGMENLGTHRAAVTWRADDQGRLSEAVYNRPAETTPTQETPAAEMEQPQLPGMEQLLAAQAETGTAEAPAETPAVQEAERVLGIPLPQAMPVGAGVNAAPQFKESGAFGALDLMLGGYGDS